MRPPTRDRREAGGQEAGDGEGEACEAQAVAALRMSGVQDRPLLDSRLGLLARGLRSLARPLLDLNPLVAIAAEFTQRVVRFTKSLRLGNGLHPDTDIGPMINLKQLEDVHSRVTEAVREDVP